jgi:hypothetical protein
VSNAVIGLKTFSIIRRGNAINEAVAILFLDAYTLGIISPKKRSRNVITPASIMNPITGFALKSKSFELINAERSTIVMFMVLFATSIVLRSFSGILYSFRMLFDFRLLSFLNFSKSSGPNEKYATSDADIKAEPRRSRIRTTNPIIIFKSGGLKIIPGREARYVSANAGSN